jgi:hypothetical protein
MNISAPFLTDHYSKIHIYTGVDYKCRICGKEFPSFRGIQCHVPKCSPRPPEPANNTKKAPVICQVCKTSFGSDRVLSAQERHRHVEVRNQMRLLDLGTDKEPGVHGNTKWSQEEINSLKELNKVYKDSKYINKQIGQVLGTKTMKQISHKRRCLGLSCRDSMKAPGMVEEETLENGPIDGKNFIQQIGLEDKPLVPSLTQQSEGCSRVLEGTEFPIPRSGGPPARANFRETENEELSLWQETILDHGRSIPMNSARLDLQDHNKTLDDEISKPRGQPGMGRCPGPVS